MEREAIERRKRAIEREYGRWSAHNFQLRDDLYTIAPGAHWHHAARLRRVVQLVHSVARKPISDLRVLDLGALEGLFAVEFARRGADVVAVEGRTANVEKIRLAKDALGLDRLDVRHEDVRELTPLAMAPSTSSCAWASSACSTPPSRWRSSIDSTTSAAMSSCWRRRRSSSRTRKRSTGGGGTSGGVFPGRISRRTPWPTSRGGPLSATVGVFV